ncbi:hypothetical protein ACGLHR_48450 [Cupriavidus sp. CuC1]
MPILQEIHACSIHAWSQNMQPWRQDAIARLHANRALQPAAYDDLYAVATKAESDLPDHEQRTPEALAVAQSRGIYGGN